MTLIGTLTYNNVPIFLGDILISGGEKDAVDIPLVQDINKLLPKNANFYINPSKQKINIIDDNLIAAWSGSYEQAYNIFLKLSQQCCDSKFNKDRLIEFCTNLDPQEYSELGLIFGVISSIESNGVVNIHSYRCILGNVTKPNGDTFGYTAASGSGQEVFYQRLANVSMLEGYDPQKTTRKSSDQKVFEAYKFTLGLSSHFVGLECSTGGANLLERWGGGYEVAISLDKFYKLGDVLHVFWYIKKNSENKYVLKLVNKLYKLDYHEDLLIYCTLDNLSLENKAITFDTKIILVSPVLKDVGDYTFPNPSKIFNFEHKYLSTTIWDSTKPVTDLIHKVDALPSEKSNIAIITEGKNIGLAFKGQYIEELREICHQHFNKDVSAVAIL